MTRKLSEGKAFVLAIDQGTTGSTAAVFKFEGTQTPRCIGRHTVEFPQVYPKPGWVEHEIGDIWKSVVDSVAITLAQAQLHPNFSTDHIASIGVTNQRETICIIDAKSRQPLMNAIVWQCRRSAEICAELRARGQEPLFRKKTGLVLDAYFSGSKLAWIFRNCSDIANALKNGRALVGTMDSMIIDRLTGGQRFVTEPSNASRTLLFDIHLGKFDTDLMKALDLPENLRMADVLPSDGLFGKTKGLGFLPDGIPIHGVLGDQQAALAGHGAVDLGTSKCTYGTGAFMLFNTGEVAVASQHRLLTTIAWHSDHKTTYALEGSCFVAGAAIQYLRDNLKFFEKSLDSEIMAARGVGAPHVYFVPSFVGLGSPHWVEAARGAVLGMTRGTSQADICRAAMEGIAFQVHDLAVAMAKDSGAKLKALRVDGGASANRILMQTQSNFLDCTLERPVNLEATVLGAALVAAKGIGLIPSFKNFAEMNPVDQRFTPELNFASNHESWFRGWRAAIGAIGEFANRSG